MSANSFSFEKDPLTYICLLYTSGIPIRLSTGTLQGFFNVPVDNLMGMPLLAKYFKKQGLDKNDDFIVVCLLYTSKEDLVPIIGDENMIQEMPEEFNKVLEVQGSWQK